MHAGRVHTSGGKQEERDQETQRRILTAAEHLFLSKGFKGVSMKDIADEVQVTTAALYYHFPEGKQDLFLSVVQQVAANWRESAFRAVAHIEDLRERLTMYAQHNLTLPNGFYTLIRDVEEFCNDKSRKRDLIRQNNTEMLERIAMIFQHAIDAGEIKKKVPATLLAHMYTGMIFGTQFSLRRGTLNDVDQSDIHEMATMMVDSLLDGIKNSADT